VCSGRSVPVPFHHDDEGSRILYDVGEPQITRRHIPVTVMRITNFIWSDVTSTSAFLAMNLKQKITESEYARKMS
jgi:hypothetical protein